jgi:hypothetical protein
LEFQLLWEGYSNGNNTPDGVATVCDPCGGVTSESRKCTRDRRRFCEQANRTCRVRESAHMSSIPVVDKPSHCKYGFQEKNSVSGLRGWNNGNSRCCKLCQWVLSRGDADVRANNQGEFISHLLEFYSSSRSRRGTGLRNRRSEAKQLWRSEGNPWWPRPLYKWCRT